MVQKIVRTTYKCEVCGREWEAEETAHFCESSPPPALQVGDVVLWSGIRNTEFYGDQQPFVYSRVLQVEHDVSGSIDRQPGHPVCYHFDNAHLVNNEIPGAKTGYLNTTHNVGAALKHSGFTLSESAVAMCNRFGLTLSDRAASWYSNFLGLLLAQRKRPQRIHLYRLSSEQQAVLRFLISSQPTSNQCLIFIMGRNKQQPAWTPFDHTQWQKWGAMVEYDLSEAFALVSSSSEDEMVQRVRDYRAAVLSGVAPYYDCSCRYGHHSCFFSLLNCNFEITGKLPKEILRWAKEIGVTGSGKTRLRRLYEAATDPKYSIKVEGTNES